MTPKMTRRSMMKLAAGAAVAAAPGTNWLFAVTSDGRIVKAAAEEDAVWEPVWLSKKEANQLAAICEAIIPETDTPGAREARVYEFIDLDLSLEPESMQKQFRDGLEWLNKRCRREYGHALHKSDPQEVAGLLKPLSDEHKDHPEEIAEGARFFRDVKSRTIFGYYTSETGRVYELGLGASVGMEQFQGCPHEDRHA